MSLFVLLIAALPWLFFTLLVGLMVLTKSLSIRRAVILLVGTFVGAALLKWGALAAFEWVMRSTLPAGDGQAGIVFLPCACWFDVPFLLALAIFLLWRPAAARAREVEEQRALDLLGRRRPD